ncbi:50S ribosomal protein L24 [Candidatus Micrarchaeota archaeon]|nr:50S ribosomal protein L24 [Candidatus Micrarchaeota archaeon]
MNCSFCSKQVTPGLGFKVFRRDGSFQGFCSNKCFANARMKRNPRKLKWTGQRQVEQAQKTRAAEKKAASASSKAAAKEAKPN